MAENEQNGFVRALTRPFTNIRNNFNTGVQEFRDHPFQEGLQRLLGIGAGVATASPAVGSAVGRGADRFFNWWNNRGNDDFGPAGGYPGITSPNQSNNANPQGPLMQMLGIPNYGAGNAGHTGPNSYATGNFNRPQGNIGSFLGIPSYAGGGSAGPNSFATGNFSQSQLGNGSSGPLVDLNYGQNPQGYQSEGGGTPGITGPNILWNEEAAAAANAANAGAGAGNAGAQQNSSVSSSGNHPSSVSQLGANGSLGASAGFATMSDIENMLSAGMHDRSSRMTQRREMSGDRGAMQQAGFAKLPGETPQAYRARAQQAGII